MSRSPGRPSLATPSSVTDTPAVRVAYEAYARSPCSRSAPSPPSSSEIPSARSASLPGPPSHDRAGVGEDVDDVVAGAGVDEERTLHRGAGEDERVAGVAEVDGGRARMALRGRAAARTDLAERAETAEPRAQAIGVVVHGGLDVRVGPDREAAAFTRRADDRQAVAAEADVGGGCRRGGAARPRHERQEAARSTRRMLR